MSAFRSWPSKVVVAGVGGEAGITYIGYSPLAGAKLANPVWIVEKISAVGDNIFASTCFEAGESEPQPKAVMTSPKDLTYTARS